MFEERRIPAGGMTLFQALHRIAKETLKGREAYLDSGFGRTEIVVRARGRAEASDGVRSGI